MSQHNISDSENLTNFSCAPDGIQTSVLWILSLTLYRYPMMDAVDGVISLQSICVVIGLTFNVILLPKQGHVHNAFFWPLTGGAEGQSSSCVFPIVNVIGLSVWTNLGH